MLLNITLQHKFNALSAFQNCASLSISFRKVRIQKNTLGKKTEMQQVETKRQCSVTLTGCNTGQQPHKPSKANSIMDGCTLQPGCYQPSSLQKRWRVCFFLLVKKQKHKQNNKKTHKHKKATDAQNSGRWKELTEVISHSRLIQLDQVSQYIAQFLASPRIEMPEPSSKQPIPMLDQPQG